MKDMMKKLMSKKDSSSKMSPIEKDAKLSSLNALKKAMEDMMGDKLKNGMKKVTIAADDQEGLEKGLEKAKELIGSEEESSEESEGEDMAEESIEEKSEMLEPDNKEEQDEKELNKKLKQLLNL